MKNGTPFKSLRLDKPHIWPSRITVSTTSFDLVRVGSIPALAAKLKR